MEPPAARPAREAIADLVERHGGRLYGVGLRLCGSPEDAQDLVQETFLSAFRHWHQFQGDAEPTTWLYTIARRACLRRRRKRSGEPAVLEPLSALLPGPDEGLPELPPGEAGPYRDRLRREAEAVVDRALARLPLTFRLPLVLADIAELSTAETARVLGLKEATVKTRVHRARLKLRRAIADTLPRGPASPPDHPRRVCLDLLRAKQEALDRGVAFPYSEAALCARCRSLFATLDLGREACRALGRGELPAPVRRALEREASSLGPVRAAAPGRGSQLRPSPGRRRGAPRGRRGRLQPAPPPPRT
jgi:RNA polymerase sigma-70 factor (ECF subfamily)